MDDKISYQATLFSNRLAKKYRLLRKWARKNRITCYRLYDRDIPEIPLAVDLYEFVKDGIEDKAEYAKAFFEENERISKNDENALAEKRARSFLHVYLYERPYKKDENDEAVWLSKMVEAASKTLDISLERIIKKTRKKQRGENQYEKIKNEKKIAGIVQECGQLFFVNLSDYLDTGLFFDHRPLRNEVRKTCSGKRVLNLFCYTGAFSVYAAEGRAKSVESVDLSKTYLDWACKNVRLNGFNENDSKFSFVRSDVQFFLENAIRTQKKYDIIILDPPTFSNSKATKNTLDINLDWKKQVRACISLLDSGGTLYFSTNSKKLKFDASAISDVCSKIEDWTATSIPEDFAHTRPHRLWKISAP